MMEFLRESEAEGREISRPRPMRRASLKQVLETKPRT